MKPLAYIEEHGVVLATAKGPVPTLAHEIAGGPIRGSWWGHPKGRAIFRALEAVTDSPDVLCFRLVDGKITLVHRRLWPALARLATRLGPDAVAAIRQEHTDSGAHRNVLTPYPAWVPRDVAATARAMSEPEAIEALGPWVIKHVAGDSRARRPSRRSR